MEGCEWQVRVTAVDKEVKERIKRIKEAIRTSDALSESNRLKREMRKIRNKNISD